MKRLLVVREFLSHTLSVFLNASVDFGADVDRTSGALP